MRLLFEDAVGRTGEVTPDLEVDYDGPWADTVQECVRRVETDLDGDGDAEDLDAARVFNRLVVELPEVAPVREVERREE